MKPVTFSKKSWHYWLATNIGDFKTYSQNDMCSYVNNVIKGLLIVLLASTIVLGCSATVISFLYHIIGKMLGLIHRSMEVYEGMGMMFVILALVVVVAMFGRDWLANRREKQYASQTPPGFIKTAYRSFKDKVCFLVEFKE